MACQLRGPHEWSLPPRPSTANVSSPIRTVADRVGQVLVVQVGLAGQEDQLHVVLVLAHDRVEPGERHVSSISAVADGLSVNARFGSVSAHGSLQRISPG